jgi:hypothetical protein
MGLILAVTAVAAIVVMALFAVREASAARSSFYVITACSAAMIFVVQAMLNVFGSTDLLPLTGVTLPFVSVGGSSMISCWSLLAFIKASDTRQNAALSVRLPRKKKKGESDEPESWRTATGFFAIPHEEPERGDEGSETVKFRPADLEGPQPAPADEERLPPLDVEEGSSDADNWREYFLKDEDWGDEK